MGSWGREVNIDVFLTNSIMSSDHMTPHPAYGQTNMTESITLPEIAYAVGKIIPFTDSKRKKLVTKFDQLLS